MENLVTFSVIFNIILLAWAVLSTKTTLSLAEKNVLLQIKVDELTVRGKMAADLIKETGLLQKKPAKPTFDATTTKLIRLAAKSSNENEARSAALQACKRINKNL